MIEPIVCKYLSLACDTGHSAGLFNALSMLGFAIVLWAINGFKAGEGSGTSFDFDGDCGGGGGD